MKHSAPYTLEKAVLILVCLLPLLVPFSVNRNLYLQGLVVVLTGVLGWTAVVIRLLRKQLVLPRSLIVLLGLYLLACLLSLVFQPSLRNLFGSPLVYLGTAAMLACPGCGLALRAIAPSKLTAWLYGSFVLLALVAIPYSLWTSHQIGRLGGVFHQADFLAVCMALGLLLGMHLWRRWRRHRAWLVVSQSLLAVILLLTQTRAVIAIVLVITLLAIGFGNWSYRRKLLGGGAMIAMIVLALIGLHSLVPNRLSDTGYVADSILYRLHLQQYGLSASWRGPLTGYGAGDVSQALRCPTLHDPELQATCRQGYYFDSSHNVFLDRVLAFGWLGGLSFVALTAVGIWRGLQARRMLFVAGSLLLTLYFLTNVSSLEMEVLFWVMLMGAYLPATNRASASR